MTAARKADTPKIFRITLEVSNIDEAAAFYARLLGTGGKRHPGARHYFDCGGVILSVLDASGLPACNQNRTKQASGNTARSLRACSRRTTLAGWTQPSAA